METQQQQAAANNGSTHDRTVEEAFDAPVVADRQPSGIVVRNNDVDQMVATAHKYPRNIKTFRDEVRSLACLNQEVAEECTYALPREGKTILGPSARFAEICVSSWGNCSVAARVIEDRGTTIVSEGVFMDHQKNTRVVKHVERRVTNKSGRRYSDDMIVVTGNAGNSIALRNAVFAGIPKAFWHDLWAASRQVAIGDASTLANRRAAAILKLGKMGATEDMVLTKLGRQSVDEMTLDDLTILLGAFQAIKEGDSTVEELFYVAHDPAVTEAEASAASKSGVADLKNKLAKKAAAKGNKPKPEEEVDKTTGEVTGKQPFLSVEQIEKLCDEAATLDKLEELLDASREHPDEARKALGEKIATKAAALAAASKK
jgi:hypothetical protein